MLLIIKRLFGFNEHNQFLHGVPQKGRRALYVTLFFTVCWMLSFYSDIKYMQFYSMIPLGLSSFYLAHISPKQKGNQQEEQQLFQVKRGRINSTFVNPDFARFLPSKKAERHE